FEFGYLYINKEQCCIGQVGDVNNDGVDANVLDLTYLVDYIFRGGEELYCPEEGNFDQDPDGNVNVVDLAYLVDYIFRGGPPPPECPQ
ncbi:MAG: dockerin type I repeat-containing protein, partial [candidate division Zixibacteria bacterium]|nr:dockerin type I repeat-containing protein [candidate division Zixibacteria bacterium]